MFHFLINTFFLNILINFIFIEVLNSHQNLAEGTEISHIPLYMQSFSSYQHFPQSCTFITIDEPILTHYYHTKSIVYILGFTFGVVHSLSFNKCMTYIQSPNII